MNWYIRTIFSQVQELTGLAGYLERLGATPDIISYITSLDKETAQYLVNAFRTNPGMGLMELQGIVMPQKIDPYLDREKVIAKNNPAIHQWILVNFRKLRKGNIPLDNDMAKNGHTILNSDEEGVYWHFSTRIPEIHDWVQRTNTDISSYSPEQAIVASDEWHRTMAGLGEGKNYELTKEELIIYGPNWKNEEFNGWTIQKIISKNDLLTEGNKMNNCVGDYCDDVERGSTNIYSLRDPANNPHVTIEIDANGDLIQIQGNSNNEPNDKYKPFIKEWIEKGNTSDIINTKLPLMETIRESYDPDINDLIEALESDSNEYGFTYYLDEDADEIAKTEIEKWENKSNGWDKPYNGDIVNLPEALINAIVREEQQKPIENQRWNKIKILENYAYKLDEETREEIIYMGISDNFDFPNQDDFETEEEYQKAIEEVEEQSSNYESEIFNNSVKGGFANDSIKYIEELRKKGIIPLPKKIDEVKDKVNV